MICDVPIEVRPGGRVTISNPRLLSLDESLVPEGACLAWVGRKPWLVRVDAVQFDTDNKYKHHELSLIKELS